MKGVTTPPEVVARIVEAFKSGMEVKDIADELQIRRDTVRYYLKKNQLIDDEKYQCKSCIYGDAEGYCMYIVITGHMRDCPARNCTRRVEGENLPIPDTFNNGFNGSRLKSRYLNSQAVFEVGEE